MTTNVTSLTGNGLKDWLIQRVSAVYLACYALFVLFIFYSTCTVTHEMIQASFSPLWMKIASLIALFMILLHAWVGLWTVTTDYLSCVMLRFSAQVFILFLLLSEFIWGCILVWSV